MTLNGKPEKAGVSRRGALAALAAAALKNPASKIGKYILGAAAFSAEAFYSTPINAQDKTWTEAIKRVEDSKDAKGISLFKKIYGNTKEKIQDKIKKYNGRTLESIKKESLQLKKDILENFGITVEDSFVEYKLTDPNGHETVVQSINEILRLDMMKILYNTLWRLPPDTVGLKTHKIVLSGDLYVNFGGTTGRTKIGGLSNQRGVAIISVAEKDIKTTLGNISPFEVTFLHEHFHDDLPGKKGESPKTPEEVKLGFISLSEWYAFVNETFQDPKIPAAEKSKVAETNQKTRKQDLSLLNSQFFTYSEANFKEVEDMIDVLPLIPGFLRIYSILSHLEDMANLSAVTMIPEFRSQFQNKRGIYSNVASDLVVRLKKQTVENLLKQNSRYGLPENYFDTMQSIYVSTHDDAQRVEKLKEYWSQQGRLRKKQ